MRLIASKLGEAADDLEMVSCRELITFDDLKIRTKKRKILTFVPNDVQVIYLDEICPGWRKHNYAIKGIRDIVLKGRQQGLSTVINALFFVDTYNNPNTNSLLAAHDKDSTEDLFQMIKFFQESLPEHKKLKPKYDSVDELYWPQINSRYIVRTAGAKGIARGNTIHNFHGSEAAFWAHAEVAAPAALETVPEDGNIFLESTANGLGNFYHEQYKLADKQGNEYTSRFFEWFRTKEYRKAGVAPWDDPKEREYEEYLAKEYGLDEEQLGWRRSKLRGPNKKKFRQEYPVSKQEAFLSSGKSYFDNDKLDRRYKALENKPPATLSPAVLVGLSPLVRRAIRNGELFIYKAPQVGQKYVLGADTAEGLTDGDFDAAHVMPRGHSEQVAVLWGHWSTHEYGLMLNDLATWYNTALLGVERNNHGHSVLNTLVNTCNYPNLYYHSAPESSDGSIDERPGFPTTTSSKAIILDTIDQHIDEDDLVIRHIDTVGECMTFVKLPKGKAGGEGSSFDDLVISLGITLHMQSMPDRFTFADLL